METSIPLVQIMACTPADDDQDVALLDLRIAGSASIASLRFNRSKQTFGVIAHSGLAALLRHDFQCAAFIAGEVSRLLDAGAAQAVLSALPSCAETDQPPATPVETILPPAFPDGVEELPVVETPAEVLTRLAVASSELDLGIAAALPKEAVLKKTLGRHVGALCRVCTQGYLAEVLDTLPHGGLAHDGSIIRGYRTYVARLACDSCGLNYEAAERGKLVDSPHTS